MSLASYRRRQRDLVKARWKAHGRLCEGCGRWFDDIDVAHLFARRHIIREPYASRPELCAALCSIRVRHTPGCHEAVDQSTDIFLRDSLRWQAIERFAEAEGLPLRVITSSDDPLGVIRACEKYLDAGRVPVPAY